MWCGGVGGLEVRDGCGLLALDSDELLGDGKRAVCCGREVRNEGVGVASAVGCIKIGSRRMSLFRKRCTIPGKVTCGSCIVLSSGITIVSAMSTGFGRR